VQASASAGKTPHNGTQSDPGTVRPAQPPETPSELGPGGCLLSVPQRPTYPPQSAKGVRSVLSTLQSSSHPKVKVKIKFKVKVKVKVKIKVKIKIKFKVKVKTSKWHRRRQGARVKPGDGTGTARRMG
jgi:hypothetical protein